MPVGWMQTSCIVDRVCKYNTFSHNSVRKKHMIFSLLWSPPTCVCSLCLWGKVLRHGQGDMHIQTKNKYIKWEGKRRRGQSTVLLLMMIAMLCCREAFLFFVFCCQPLYMAQIHFCITRCLCAECGRMYELSGRKRKKEERKEKEE